jgi:hypothetical protein
MDSEEAVSPLVWTSIHLPACFSGEFLSPLLALAQCPDIVLAGGSVMALGRAALGLSVDKHPIRDIDVFVLGSTGLQMVLERLIQHPESLLLRQDLSEGFPLVVVRNPLFSSNPIQVLFGSLGHTMQSLLYCFDFDCVGAALVAPAGGEDPLLHMWTLPSTIGSWHSMVAQVVNASAVRERHATNIVAKGYTLKTVLKTHLRRHVNQTLSAAMKTPVYDPSPIASAMAVDDNYVQQGASSSVAHCLAAAGIGLRYSARAMLSGDDSNAAICYSEEVAYPYPSGEENLDRCARTVFSTLDPALVTMLLPRILSA